MGISRRDRTVLFVAILFTALCATLGLWWFAVASRGAYEKLWRAELNGVREAVVQDLRQAESLALQVGTRTRARRLLFDFESGRISAAEFEAESSRILIDALHGHEDLTSIYRFDRDGNRVVSVGARIPEENWITTEFEVKFHGPVLESGDWHLLVASPILDREGVFLGSDLVSYRLQALGALFEKQRDDKHMILLSHREGRTLLFLHSPELPSVYLTSLEGLERLLPSWTEWTQNGVRFVAHSTSLGERVGFFEVPAVEWRIVSLRKPSLLGISTPKEFRFVTASFVVLLVLEIAILGSLLRRDRGQPSTTIVECGGLETDTTSSQGKAELNEAGKRVEAVCTKRERIERS